MQLLPPVLVVPRAFSVPKIDRIHAASHYRAVALVCSALFHAGDLVHQQTCGGNRMA